jgi:3-deoxy-D-manno-octulosonic-acid transferase
VHPLLRFPYVAAGYAVRAAAHALPETNTKLVRALRGRRGLGNRVTQWARAERDRHRPLIWLHAPSVGEGLQAKPVIGLLRSRRPDVQIAYTYFSPSAAGFARSIGADFSDYLPFDTAGDADRILGALEPAALIYSKLDVWPIITARAAGRGVALGLISATLAPGSGRLGIAGRALLGDAYRALDRVGAIDAETGDRLVELGVRRDALEVTGDTRYDQVWEKALGVDPASPLLTSHASERPTLVAGSTWPADEEHLLPAFNAARKEANARLIIAPHEPTAAHLAPIERWAVDAGVAVARLDTQGASSADVVIVDRVGVLGELYALADVAFVGGGFHGSGLHSVLEPAAYGVPTLFGPRGAGRDARLLVARGGGASVETRGQLAHRLVSWLTDAGARSMAGEAAQELIRDGLGAAERTYSLIERLLRH